MIFNHQSPVVSHHPQISDFFKLAGRAQLGALAGSAELIVPAGEACAERVKKFGRVGVYESKSLDWVASIASVEKLYPEYTD